MSRSSSSLRLEESKETISFILANTEQLHDRILQLSERVRQLEGGLKTLQSSVSSDSHPLLSSELLRIKNSQELYGGMTQSVSEPTASYTDMGEGVSPSRHINKILQSEESGSAEVGLKVDGKIFESHCSFCSGYQSLGQDILRRPLPRYPLISYN